MNRLIKKNKYGEFEPIKHNEVCDKLGKLEDIEDELGCPLVVVFKAFEERYVIFKHVVGVENPIIKLETHKVLGLICVCEKFGLELCDGVFGDEFYVYTKDYGKTWWLVSDEESEE